MFLCSCVCFNLSFRARFTFALTSTCFSFLFMCCLGPCSGDRANEEVHLAAPQYLHVEGSFVRFYFGDRAIDEARGHRALIFIFGAITAALYINMHIRARASFYLSILLPFLSWFQDQNTSTPNTSVFRVCASLCAFPLLIARFPRARSHTPFTITQHPFLTVCAQIAHYAPKLRIYTCKSKGASSRALFNQNLHEYASLRA